MQISGLDENKEAKHHDALINLLFIVSFMCDRFLQYSDVNGYGEHISATPDVAVTIAPSCNVAPTQRAWVVREQIDQGRTISPLRWGLIALWAKDKRIGQKMINARLETVTEKLAFLAAMKRRRCLIPAKGFYEWLAGPQFKTPYAIVPNVAPFVFFRRSLGGMAVE